MQKRAPNVNTTTKPAATKRTTRHIVPIKAVNISTPNTTAMYPSTSTVITTITAAHTSVPYQITNELKTTSSTQTLENAKKCKPKRSKRCIQARRAARKAAARKRANNKLQNN